MRLVSPEAYVTHGHKQGSMVAWQMILVITMTNLSKYLWFGRKILVSVLSYNKHAAITIPWEKIIEYQHKISEHCLFFCGALATMDELKLYSQQAGVNNIQESYYNGKWHDGTT